MADLQHPTPAPGDARAPWTTPRLQAIDVLRNTKSGFDVNAAEGETTYYRPS